MFRKVTFLESRATAVFHQFILAARTSSWYNGVEMVPASYGRRKPYDGDKREVIVWQGSRTGNYRKLTVHFVYRVDSGGYSWLDASVTFAGRTFQSDKEWAKSFHMAIKNDGTRVFIPAHIDFGAWIEMTPEERQKAFENYLRA